MLRIGGHDHGISSWGHSEGLALHAWHQGLCDTQVLETDNYPIAYNPTRFRPPFYEDEWLPVMAFKNGLMPRTPETHFAFAWNRRGTRNGVQPVEEFKAKLQRVIDTTSSHVMVYNAHLRRQVTDTMTSRLSPYLNTNAVAGGRRHEYSDRTAQRLRQHR